MIIKVGLCGFMRQGGGSCLTTRLANITGISRWLIHTTITSNTHVIRMTGLSFRVLLGVRVLRTVTSGRRVARGRNVGLHTCPRVNCGRL